LNAKNDNIKILFVDDEKKIVERIKKTLTSEGYFVETAANGNEAIERLKESVYDIVLTDLNMPDKSGFDVMEFIKECNLDTIPIILTGYASVEGAIQSIKLGAYDFIEKPIDAPTLKLAIRRTE
jgi:DNA-binding NtrC family response regulator